MNLDEFKKLVKKQQSGTLTQAEQEALNTFEKQLFIKNKSKVFYNEKHRQAVKKSLSEKIKIKALGNSTLQWLKIAASLAFLFGISYLIYNSLGPQQIIVLNDQLSPKTIQLADGSIITLNNNSKLVYWDDFNENNRNVTLSGEAFFKVAKSKQKPFIIKTGALATRVVGTEFNIKETTDNVSVTVTEGQVKVYHQKDTLRVVPNQQVSFNLRSKKMNRDRVNTELYSIWYKDEIELNDVTLEEVTVVFNKLYNVKALFLSEEDKKVRMSLSFNKNEDIQNIIDRINLTNEVQLKKENKMLKITH